MRTSGGVAAILMAGVLGLMGAGCERWPWESEATSATTKGATAQPPSPQPPSGLAVPERERIAMVNQGAISMSDVEMALRELKQFVQSAGQEWKPLAGTEDPNALDLADVMQNLVALELKAQDARARGLDRKSDVQKRLAYLERSFLAQEWDRFQRDLASPTQEEIHKFYEDYKLGFLDPERIQVRQVVANTLAEAEAVRARAIQGEPFQQLARELSVGPGKEQGGDVGWFLREADKNRLTLIGASPTEEVFFPQLEPVAFALEKDQVSQPVKGPDNTYYIVQLVDRKPARQRAEVEVHDGIKETLIVQKMQEQLEQLRKKAQIKEFPERLESVEQ